MINEEKVKLMTKLAVYEKNQENQDLVMSKYYKNDYVRYNCLKTVVTSTICYWVIVIAVVMLKFQDILNQINEMDYIRLIYILMVGYVAFAFIYTIIAYIIYNIRYTKAKPGLINYNKNLKKLIELETEEDAGAKPETIKVSANIGGDISDLDNFDDSDNTGKGKY